jgi:hypothetical protein
MFTNCPEHAYVGMLPCPWPDCARGVAGESIPSLMPSLSAAGHERRNLRGPDGALRYFWALADMPLSLAVGNLVRNEQERRAGPSPALLYHYTPLAGFRGIVESETLWMTDYSYLNDAREFHLGVERATTILTKSVGDTRYAALHTVLADLLEDLRAMPAERILLTCFCGKADSLSHWDRYSKSGVGVAIGMRASDLLPSLGYPGQTTASKVIYEPIDQERLLQDLLHFASLAIAEDAMHPKHDPAAYRRLLQRHLYELLVLFKDEGFSDEREYRFAYIDDTSLHHFGLGPVPLKFRVANHLMVPYATMRDLAKVDPGRLPIEEVIVSPHADAASTVRGISEFLEHCQYDGVTVRESVLKLR